MSATAPWSVKGIDPKAREIAKDLARRSGMTLGEWLNSMIMDEPEEEGSAPSARRAPVAELYERRGRRRPGEAFENGSAIENLIAEMGERLEAAERRSATAIQGIDQAVSGLMRRMDAERDLESQRERRLDNMSRELREGHQRLKAIEETSSGSASGGLKARLDQAQEATRTALEGLQNSFGALEKRLGQIETRPSLDNGELTQLVDGLRQQIDTNRQELISRLAGSPDGSRLDRLEKTFEQLRTQTKAAELRSANAVEAMGHEVMRIARNMNSRMVTIEQDNSARSEVMDQRLAELGRVLDEKLDREIARHTATVETRLTRQEDQHALALERLGGEITRISDRLSERITQTERRSSQAIDDISRRLAENTEKLERRSNDVSGELAERMRQSEERTLRLLEEAKAVRARRESAAQNASARLSMAIEPDTNIGDVPAFISDTPAVSLFGNVQSEPWQSQGAGDWRANAPGNGAAALDTPLPEAQASEDWADTVATDMAVEPFPTKNDFRPFGTLEGDLEDDLLINELVAETPVETPVEPQYEQTQSYEDANLEAQAYQEPQVETFVAPEAPVAEPADGYPSIFASVLNEELREVLAESGIGEATDQAAGEPVDQELVAEESVEALFEAPSPDGYEQQSFEETVDATVFDPFAEPAAPTSVINPQDYLEAEEFIPQLDYSSQTAVEQDQGAYAPVEPDTASYAVLPDAEAQQAEDFYGDGYVSTREALESVRAAITEEAPLEEAPRKTFGLNKLRKKGGTSALQQKLDRKAARDGSTFGQALKVSALAMLVVGGGGYGTLKLVKDQNLDLNFGHAPQSVEPTVPMAALALDGAPLDAVPSRDVAETEGAAIYERAIAMIDQGDATGLEPLKRSAELGYVPAQMRLASLYTEGGLGIQRNPAEAREWVRRAAEAGEPRAMQYYATQLYDGVGGARDELAAVEWMRKSAEAGSVDSQYNLAHLYENGVRGMAPNKVEAFSWYMIAARRGDQQALQAVQRLTQQLNVEQRRTAREVADNFSVQPLG